MIEARSVELSSSLLTILTVENRIHVGHPIISCIPYTILGGVIAPISGDLGMVWPFLVWLER